VDWKLYEEEIYQHFAEEFPSACIVRDARIIGRYSKVERQVDVLIEGTIAGFRLRIAIDAKHRSRRIDVTDVEAFIGFCADIDASKGVLISLKGHSQAATNRAYNDDSSIELDVLNFSDLKLFHSHAALPYAGSHGVFLMAPFGWIVDGTMRKDAVATLYQRGYDLDKAGRAKEWMYVNFWAKDATVPTLDALIKHQDEGILKDFPSAKVTYQEGPRREKGATKIRWMIEQSYPAHEYTGFVEFEHFIFFCVLFTPPELASRNLRKLEYILSTVMPFGVKHATAA
jgi:hypothetical protein